MDPYEAEVKNYIIEPLLQYCRPDHFANLDGQASKSTCAEVSLQTKQYYHFFFLKFTI